MGTNQNVLGLVFASIHDDKILDLTKYRTMGSVPFGGRYRLIDFPLSNFVNSGISQVGVITKRNYGSLLDHIGSGREWDLASKKGGLHLLPPFSHTSSTIYSGRLDALGNIWSFVEHAAAEYVVLSNCDVVTNIDFRPAIAAHIKSGAEITAIYAKGFYDHTAGTSATIFELDENGFVTDAAIDPPMTGECRLGLDMFVMSKDFLRKIVKESMSRNLFSLRRDILLSRTAKYKILGYEHQNYFSKIDSLADYFQANLDLLDSAKRNAIFTKAAPIYTNTKDNAPVHFGADAVIRNSLIADGCIIEGRVENCVLFRGVRIGKNTIVRDSIIMQGGTIGANGAIRNIIADRNVRISDDRQLTGSKGYPLFIGKGAEI
ncbi:MAG: glucose-1-phosphate adenylyltransferase subunit GlgD [Oscillospiraceae bacterium]|nr:glucose-1-phosphate adenylyltransferase subunit GlgD [Oscillospiraceae bacterium]